MAENSLEAIQKYASALQEKEKILNEQMKATMEAVDAAAKSWGDAKLNAFKVAITKDQESIKPLSEAFRKYVEQVLNPKDVILKTYDDFVFNI